MYGAATSNRVKVSIRCRKCGERFILKGKKEHGRYSTGFKQCVCDNENDFEVEIDDHA